MSSRCRVFFADGIQLCTDAFLLGQRPFLPAFI
jgi:hypothetical protein